MEERLRIEYEKILSRTGGGYSIFDSALYGKLEAKWLFPQEKATSHDLQMIISESKMRWEAELPGQIRRGNRR